MQGQNPSFNQVFGEFLDKQRHAIGPVQYILNNIRRHRLAARDPVNHQRAKIAAQPVELQNRHMGFAVPIGLKFRPERADHQNFTVAHLIDDMTQKLNGARIHPM